MNSISSQMLVVRGDVLVRDCIRKMAEERVGSILVVSDDSKEKLVGIFTERDLLMKFDSIHEVSSLGMTIKSVMTHPVITIDWERLPEAGSIMLHRNIRHLPVVSNDESGEPVLIGIVSMRDLFSDLIRGKSPAAKKGGPPLKTSAQKPVVSLLSMDARTVQLFERDLPKLLKITVRRNTAAELVEMHKVSEMAGISTLVIDLDNPESERWLQYLRTDGKSKRVPFTFIVFDPARHSEKTVEQLERLNTASHLAVYSKPISLVALFDQLKPLL